MDCREFFLSFFFSSWIFVPALVSLVPRPVHFHAAILFGLVVFGGAGLTLFAKSVAMKKFNGGK
jgi:hypothetical protein